MTPTPEQIAEYRKEVTQEFLKKNFLYDPMTGIFTRLTAYNNRNKVGEICGHSSHGYILFTINYKLYQAHRLAWLYMYGYLPSQIDHINGVRSDNRIINLRPASTSENAMNTGIRIDNKSGFKGVSWDKNKNKWQVKISFQGKQKHLGRFDTKEEASQKYQEFAIKSHGEFYKGIV